MMSLAVKIQDGVIKGKNFYCWMLKVTQYSWRKDGLPRHGGDWIQLSPETQVKRDYKSGP